ncbi:MAG: dipeptidase [Bacteroidota bacterium]|nr:dipeptidase [Bacteroidota bacterium]
MRDKAKKLSEELIIADGHIDLPYRLHEEGLIYEENIDLNHNTNRNFDIPKARKGGLNSPFMSIYIPSEKTYSEGFELANSLIDLVENIVESNKDHFQLALTPEDVINNFNNNKISLPMGMENGSPIGENINNLKFFFDRGIRYVTLTHAKNNQICDSSYDTERKWNGLSEFGKELIKEMNKIGMMIDVSHVSDKTFYDILNITEKPLIASHSSPRKFTPNFERNMSDDMIIELAKNNGVILINFGSSFVNNNSNMIFFEIDKLVESWRIENGYEVKDENVIKKRELLINQKNPFASIDDVLDAIDHVNNLVGQNHIGFGSDFDGLGNSLPSNLKDVSFYPKLIEGLLKRGYNKESIEKICYKNFFRVWNANLQNHQI